MREKEKEGENERMREINKERDIQIVGIQGKSSR